MFHPEGPTVFELLRQSLSSTERGYDLLAPKFDRTPFRTPEVVLEPAFGRVRECGDVDRSLDLCCGTGAALPWLDAMTRVQVVGLDRSAGMLSEARRRLETLSERVTLVRGDAVDMPFTGSFDLVTCFGAFGHIQRTEERRFVRSIYRALSPGGRFAFVTAEKPGWTRPSRWLFAGFNQAMRLRNAIIKPEFVMYYLTFTLGQALPLLADQGFLCRTERDVFPGPLGALALVTATKPR